LEKSEKNWSGKLARKGIKNLKANILVFSIFLFMSFVFWYINSLGKTIQSDIKYPVQFINVPKDRELESVPSKLNLVLQGTGFSMLRLKISGSRDPAVIDLLKVPYKSIRSSAPAGYYLVTSGLVQNFNTQLKPECRITSIRPDTIFFSFKEVIEE
jgi:hypothetical protein